MDFQLKSHYFSLKIPNDDDSDLSLNALIMPISKDSDVDYDVAKMITYYVYMIIKDCGLCSLIYSEFLAMISPDGI